MSITNDAKYEFARYLNIRSATSPVLSPDGLRVAYLTDTTGNWQVWSAAAFADATADPPRQLTYLGNKVWEIRGTGHAEHLIAVSDVGGNERQQFYLVSNYGTTPDGRFAHDVRRLTENDDAIHTFGAWSPDGQQIVYTSNARNGVDFDIYYMHLRSGQSQRLRECNGRRVVVCWFGDDRYILSVDTVGPEQIELYLLDTANGEERHLTAGHPRAPGNRV